MTVWSLVFGLVGALLVFILGFIRELWRNDRERVGLLRLLRAEIAHNVEVVNTLDRLDAGLLNVKPMLRPRIKAVVWHDVRKRAALLLPKWLSKTLNNYYSPLEELLMIRQFQDPSEVKLDNEHVLLQEAIRKKAGEVPPSGAAPATDQIIYRNYVDRTLHAQDEALQQLSKYLSSSWVARLFGGR